ncbi:hypothetical protein A4R35_01025 [Thermogemmatispora tikiterensis]|uniref:Blue (type 1) copper domain-containing protein n=1 Tax=Thermogemmatispora tikiterensis TaxID=1825093 RepID=A0A328VFJ6_9CHLR|nr:hypothetical protein A4R35_01025 [Thermogemmatispora tikiterensis]
MTVLSLLTVLALIVTALACGSLMLLAGLVIVPLLILALVSLALAGLIACGLLWAPLLGAFFGLGLIPGGLLTQQYFGYHLTHPGEVAPFMASLLMLLAALVMIVAGGGATFQNYRGGERQAPRWLTQLLSALAGFILGALCVSLLVAVTPVPSASTTSAGLPAVHMGISAFSQSSITIPKGSKLVLVDDGQYLHILRYGRWLNGSPHPQEEPGAPRLDTLQIQGGSVTIGPFTTAGTYYIYCTIHPGMTLTVIVQ